MKAKRSAKSVNPVRPNAGVEAWYARQLNQLVNRMSNSISYWMLAAYRQSGMAGDALGPDAIASELRKRGAHWQSVFDKIAKTLAKSFVDRVRKHSDDRLRDEMRVAGFKVQFAPTREMRETLAATLQEQVGLIKSIPQKYLTDVQGLVMRSAMRGRDVGTLAQELKEQHGVTHRRANLIARDQNNKATATMTQARQTALGIEEGFWMHSHAGKTPRPLHVKANGKRFNIKKGMLIDGEYILPGEKINCRCTWRPIIPGFEA